MDAGRARPRSSSRSSRPRSRARAPASGWPRSTASSRRAAGGIAVCSEPGRGTTFRIYLPRADEAGAEPAPRGREAPAGRGRDDPRWSRTTTRCAASRSEVLDRQRVRVLEAAATARGRADRRATRRTDRPAADRRRHAGHRRPATSPTLAPARRPGLRVLFMSGYTDDVDRAPRRAGAGTAFLEKPFAGPDLARKVREVLDAPPDQGS